jgi:uncharacterized membrane-anchored protein
MTIKGDPQRDLVWQELHARPYVRFSAPAHVFHLAFLTGEGKEAADQASLARLREAMGLQATYETARHAIYSTRVAGLGRLVVSWERHGEFVAFSFFLYELELPFQPFGLDSRAVLPAGFPEHIGAGPLVATRLAIGSEHAIAETPESLSALFEGHTVNGSQLMDGQARAWSCYRVHGDGFGRIALVVGEASPHSLGRTVERLLSIEDLYHLTLLALPLAREVRLDLASCESRLVHEVEALRVADSLEGKRAVLGSLLGLATQVENVRARVSNRFAASSAYFALLESRFAELREAKIERALRLSRFVMRRLVPAAQTYRSVIERMANLSERIDRAADLLRTRVDLQVEEQNQRLLESAERTSRLQLRLQHAVEGLSVVVISYYSLGLIGYALRASRSLGVNVDVERTLGLLVPVVLLAVWGVIELIRRRAHDRS